MRFFYAFRARPPGLRVKRQLRVVLFRVLDPVRVSKANIACYARRASTAPRVVFPPSNTARIASFRASEFNTSPRLRYAARRPRADEEGTASMFRRAGAVQSVLPQISPAARSSKAQTTFVAILLPSACGPATPRTRALSRLGPGWPYSHELSWSCEGYQSAAVRSGVTTYLWSLYPQLLLTW